MCPEVFARLSAVMAPLADEAANAFVSVAIRLQEGSTHAELAGYLLLSRPVAGNLLPGEGL